MKLSHTTTANTQHVTVQGEVVGAGCTCLGNFWRQCVSDDVDAIEVDMAGVDSVDAVAIAQLVELLRDSAARGQALTLIAPPQLLAHTLYKVGLLQPTSQIRIESPRAEEPYAG